MSHPQEDASQLCQHELERTENSNNRDSKSSHVYSTEFCSSKKTIGDLMVLNHNALKLKRTPNTPYAIIRFCGGKKTKTKTKTYAHKDQKQDPTRVWLFLLGAGL